MRCSAFSQDDAIQARFVLLAFANVLTFFGFRECYSRRCLNLLIQAGLCCLVFLSQIQEWLRSKESCCKECCAVIMFSCINMNICIGWGSCSCGLLSYLTKGEWWWEMLTSTIAVLVNNLLWFLCLCLFVFFLLRVAHRVVSWEGEERALLKIAQSNMLLKKPTKQKQRQQKKQTTNPKNRKNPKTLLLTVRWTSHENSALMSSDPSALLLSLSAGEKELRSPARVPWLWPRDSGPRLVQLLCFQQEWEWENVLS